MVTAAVTETVPIVAVIVAVPGDTAVTLPLPTVAIVLDELVQVIVVAGQLDGVTVALICVVSGTAMVSVAGSRVIAEMHGGTVITADPAQC